MIGNPFSKPATEKYPKEKLHLNDNYRGKPIFDYDACIGCGLCSRECPAKAIEMVPVGDRKAPQLNLASCVFCYHCAEVCPKKCIHNSTDFELASTDKSSLVLKPKEPAKHKVL